MTQPCPTDNELAAFVTGALAADALLQLEAHVDECTACRHVVAMASQGSSPVVSGPGNVLQPGDRLGRYEIERLIGGGGMGVLYLARDPKLARRVAVKVMRPAYGGRDGHARLLREARAMATLSHPNVVNVFDIGEAHERVFMAMEWLEGGTLREWAERPREWGALVKMFCAAGEGLAAAHEAGVVHRDFKPENVIIGKDGRPRVGDFGLALAEDASARREERPALSRLTQTGMVLGTPAYMSPEQLLGHPADQRTDQYAFCVSLWEALAPHQPFLQDALPEGGPVPAHVWAALARGLNPRPGERFPDLRALLDTLQRPAPTAAPRLSRVALGLAALAMVTLTGLGVAVGRATTPVAAVRTESPEPVSTVEAPAPEAPSAGEAQPDPDEAPVVPVARAAVPGRTERWKESTPPAPAAQRSWPQNTEVHVVSGYEAGDDQQGPRVAIKLDRPGANVVLVLAAYGAIEWTVTASPKTRLLAIVLSNRDGQSELIAPRGVPRRELKLPYLSNSTELRSMKLALRRAFGVDRLASVHASYGIPRQLTIVERDDSPGLAADGVESPDAPPQVELDYFDVATNRRLSGRLGPELLPALRGLGEWGATFVTSATTRFELGNDGLTRIDGLGTGARTLWRPTKNVPTPSWPKGIAFDPAKQELVVGSSDGGGGRLYRIDAKTGRWLSAQQIGHQFLMSLAVDPVDGQLYGTTDNRQVLVLSPTGTVVNSFEELPAVGHLLKGDEHHLEQELVLVPAKEGLLILGFAAQSDEDHALHRPGALRELRGMWFAPRGSLQPELIWRAPLVQP